MCYTSFIPVSVTAHLDCFPEHSAVDVGVCIFSKSLFCLFSSVPRHGTTNQLSSAGCATTGTLSTLACSLTVKIDAGLRGDGSVSKVLAIPLNSRFREGERGRGWGDPVSNTKVESYWGRYLSLASGFCITLTHTHTHTRTGVYTHVHTCTHTHSHTHAHMHMHTHAHTHAHMHMHTRMLEHIHKHEHIPQAIVH